MTTETSRLAPACRPDGSFANEVLDSLSAHIAVLDTDGVIVAVNEAWKRFSRENGGQDGDAYVGTSYLDVCREAILRSGDKSAEAALQGIGAMLRGERTELSLEYSCSSPWAERWFILRCTTFHWEEGHGLVLAHEDITARKRAEAALRETEQTLRRVLEALPVGVWIMDPTGQIIHGNPAGQQIWEGARYVGPEQYGEYKGWWVSTGQPVAAEEWAAARAIRDGETSIDEEIEIECFDGTRKVILNSGVPLFDAQQRISGAIIVNQDITRRKQSEEELRRTKDALEKANRELRRRFESEQHLARTDGLTKVSNRRHFLDLAKYELAVARRHHYHLSVVLLDVDHFKQINDTWGHQVGDELLKRVAAIARGEIRESDVLARYGGDEFILLVSNSDARQAAVLAERIRARVAKEGGDTGATVSAGVADLLFARDTLDQLIERADRALYRAKEEGRNRTVLAAPAENRRQGAPGGDEAEGSVLGVD